MQAKLQREGDELALVFEPAWVEQFGLAEGASVRLTEKDGMLHIDPIDEAGAPTIDTDNNPHPPAK